MTSLLRANATLVNLNIYSYRWKKSPTRCSLLLADVGCWHFHSFLYFGWTTGNATTLVFCHRPVRNFGEEVNTRVNLGFSFRNTSLSWNIRNQNSWMSLFFQKLERTLKISPEELKGSPASKRCSQKPLFWNIYIC